MIMVLDEAAVEQEMKSSQDRSGEVGGPMEHQEAIEMMASEKYLLDELTPELRDAFEDHFFGCTECALDVRLGADFIDHAKTILPTMDVAYAPVTPARTERKPVREKRDWFAWLRPAVMVPAFACLLAIVGYQNLVVYPALQVAATEPQILPPATVLHEGTRGGHAVVSADRVLGSHLAIELPSNANYASYKFEFFASNDKLIWSHTAPGAANEDTISMWLPGSMKQDVYKLAISGITSSGESISLEQQIFDLQVKK